MTTETTQKEIFHNYMIYRYSDEGNINPFRAIIQSKQSARWGRWSKTAQYGAFTTAEKLEAWIDSIKAKIQARQDAKATKRLADKALAQSFVNPYKIGDILHSSWGYDQTNVEWFEVVAIKPRSICIRELKAVTKTIGLDYGDSYPLPGQFCGEPIWEKVVVKVYGGQISHSVKSPIYGNLYKDDGKLKHNVSWGH